MIQKRISQSACTLIALTMAALAGSAYAGFNPPTTDRPVDLIAAADSPAASGSTQSAKPDCKKNPTDERCKNEKSK